MFIKTEPIQYEMKWKLKICILLVNYFIEKKISKQKTKFLPLFMKSINRINWFNDDCFSEQAFVLFFNLCNIRNIVDACLDFLFFYRKLSLQLFIEQKFFHKASSILHSSLRLFFDYDFGLFIVGVDFDSSMSKKEIF